MDHQLVGGHCGSEEVLENTGMWVHDTVICWSYPVNSEFELLVASYMCMRLSVSFYQGLQKNELLVKVKFIHLLV